METISLKKSMSINQRLKLLEERNLIIDNKDQLSEYISTFNTYYHITGYRFLLKNYDKESDNYNHHHCNELIALSELDKKIYTVLQPHLRQIEQGLRARISNLCYESDMLSFFIDQENKELVIKDNFWKCCDNSGLFVQPTNFARISKELYKDLSKNLNEPAIAHYIKDHNGIIPIWVIVNFLTLGNLISLIDSLTSVKLNQFTNNLPYKKASNKNNPRRNDLLAIRMLRNKISHFSMLLGKNSPYCYNKSILNLGIVAMSKISFFLFKKDIYHDIIDNIKEDIKEINKKYETNIDIYIINNIAITYTLQRKNN